MGLGLHGRTVSAGFDGGGGARDASEVATPVTPPIGLLWAAAFALAAAMALLAAGRQPAHLAGYGLSALVAVGLVAAFRRVDKQRRRNRYYSPRRALDKVATILAVATVLVAIVHTWAIATWLAS